MNCTLRSFLLCLGLLTAIAGPADDVPIAPLGMEQVAPWGEVYTLEAKMLRLVISPETASVVSLQHRISGEWLEAPLRCRAFSEAPRDLQQTDWESRAWRTSEGRQLVMLSRSFGPPLSLRIVHLIELNPEGTGFTQRTRITGTGPGDQSLLTPLLEAPLRRPSELREGPHALFLRYEGIICSWQADWRIESPEQPLESSFGAGTKENSLLLSSQPLPPYPLPPQGWTLLCEFSMKWNPVETEYSAPSTP
ncbi:MAG: hypothetical protein ACO3NW_11280 [Kiritimatiellia bacterium]